MKMEQVIKAQNDEGEERMNGLQQTEKMLWSCNGTAHSKGICTQAEVQKCPLSTKLEHQTLRPVTA